MGVNMGKPNDDLYNPPEGGTSDWNDVIIELPGPGIPTPVKPEETTNESESETESSEEEIETTSEEVTSENSSEEIETGPLGDPPEDIPNQFDEANVEAIVLAINEQTEEIQRGNIAICLGLGLLVGAVFMHGFRIRRV